MSSDQETPVATAEPEAQKADTPGRLDSVKNIVGERYASASEAVRKGVTDVRGKVGETYGEVSGKVRETYTEVRGKVGETYDEVSGKVKETYTDVRKKVDEVDFPQLAENGRAYVRSNPGKALLASLAVGFVIGLLLRRGDED